MVKADKERVYCYAVVLDSSAPYYHDEISKYMCTFKIIDDTYNPKDNGKPGHMQLTFFSRVQKEIPANVKMGSIVRIHRGDVKKYLKTHQLNCDTGIKAAYCIFDANEGFLPTYHTGQNYTFAEEDKKRLKDLRTWATKFFKSFDVTEVSSAGAKKGEVDMFAQVMEIKSKEKDKTHVKLTVFDGEEFHKMDIIKSRFPNVAPKDIVRIRGMAKKGGELEFNDYTNIIKIDNSYEAAKTLLEAIEKALKNKEIADEYESYVPTPGKAHVISEVLDDKPALISLKKLFGMENAKAKDKKFRINVHPLELGPKDTKSWIVPVDAKTRKQYNVPENVNQYYKFQIFAKDATATDDNNVYTIFLCSVDGKGKEFLPAPGKAKKGEKENADLKKAYRLLTKASSTLDLIVEGVPVAGGSPIFFIVDTKLKI